MPPRVLGFFAEPLLPDAAIQAVIGETPASMAPRRPSGELTVVSWNIAYGRSLERVAGVLQRLDPDVCLLQEVDAGCRRSGFVNIAASLGERLGMHWVFAGEFQEIGEGRPGMPALTGQAILSGCPIESPDVIPFSRQAKLRWHVNPVQPRRGARIALLAETFGMRVYNLHLESGKDDVFRRAQVEDVMAAEHSRGREDVPVIIGGDFNTGRSGHAPLLEMLRARGFEDPFPTEPATRRTSTGHPQALDWLFVRQLVPLSATIAGNDDASDHFPVVVRLWRSD
jgi:endonuclease/exonuclease/phosphatase family metal-dependent hydrolase